MADQADDLGDATDIAEDATDEIADGKDDMKDDQVVRDSTMMNSPSGRSLGGGGKDALYDADGRKRSPGLIIAAGGAAAAVIQDSYLGLISMTEI